MDGADDLLVPRPGMHGHAGRSAALLGDGGADGLASMLTGLRPDAHFETIAALAPRVGLCTALAALAGGTCAAILAPATARPLLTALTAGQEPGGSADLAVRSTLSLGDDGRVHACNVRAWLVGPPSAEGAVRVVLNGAAGPYLCRPVPMGADAVVEDVRAWASPRVLEACGLGGPADGPCLAVVARSQRALQALGVAAGWDDGAAAALPGSADALLAEALAAMVLKVQRRCDTALAAAHYLAAHPGVAWVSYPGLPDDSANDPARRTLEHGFGPLVAFGLADDAQVHESAPDHDDRCPGGLLAQEHSMLAYGPVPGSRVLVAGLEAPMDVVAGLERAIFKARSGSLRIDG